jgi:hypothetical protein
VVSSDVYRTLSIYRKGLLLPSLQELRWTDNDEVVFPYAQLFLGKQLNSITSGLLGVDHLSVLSAFLASIPLSSPRIRNLELQYHMLRDKPVALGLSMALSSMICHLPYLRYLSSGAIPLTGDALRHLSNSSDIRVLRIPNDINDISHALSGTTYSTQSVFPSLVHLSAPSHQLATLSAVFHIIRPKRLEGFHVSFNGLYHPTADEMHKIFLSLERLLPPTSFSHIRISENRSHNIDDVFEVDDNFLTLDTFKPLFTFKNLISINLTLDCPLNLDDAAIQSMAVAWPKLEVLVLGGHHWGREPTITLNSFVSLATHCPELRTLGIFLDASISRLDNFNVNICNRNLDVLQVGASVLDETSQVAAYLYRLFPNLTDIFGWAEFIDDEGEVLYTKWAEVQDLINESRRIGKRWSTLSLKPSSLLVPINNQSRIIRHRTASTNSINAYLPFLKPLRLHIRPRAVHKPHTLKLIHF